MAIRSSTKRLRNRSGASNTGAEGFYPPHIQPPERLRHFPLMLPRFMRNPLLCIPREVYEKPIVFVPGPPPRAYVCDPELVKTVLLDRREFFPKTTVLRRVLGPLLGNGILLSEGDEWRWQRQTVAPLFRHTDILDYVPAMVAAGERQIELWRAAGPSVTHMVDRDMSRTTYEIISRTMLAGGGDTIGRAMGEDTAGYLAGLPWLLVYAVLGIPEWVPRPRKERMRRRESQLRGAVREVVRQRRAEPADTRDLLGRLLAACRFDTEEPMSDEEVVDTLLTFLVAGHDTTAKVLTWTLYLLSRSLEWEERLVTEIRDIVPAGAIAAAHVERLPTVLQIVKEALRLYPPAPETTRIASAETELGGIKLKAGTIIDIPIYAIHRHRALWRDPDIFDPGRFSSEQEAVRPRYHFMPFGAGPRVCVGASFALVEATVLLALFVREFRFSCPPGFEPEPVARITLGPRDGMPMMLSERRRS
jgi:cytochrome P450